MNTTLQERLRLAMDGPPKVSQAALARACKISPQSVNDWLRGVTLKLDGANLLAASRVLGVSPDWLATGKGQMHGPAPAQSVRLDADKLAQSFSLLRDAFALKGRAFDVAAHADLLALVYEHLVNPDENGETGVVLAAFGIPRGAK